MHVDVSSLQALLVFVLFILAFAFSFYILMSESVRPFHSFSFFHFILELLDVSKFF